MAYFVCNFVKNKILKIFERVQGKTFCISIHKHKSEALCFKVFPAINLIFEYLIISILVLIVLKYFNNIQYVLFVLDKC